MSCPAPDYGRGDPQWSALAARHYAWCVCGAGPICSTDEETWEHCNADHRDHHAAQGGRPVRSRPGETRRYGAAS